MSLQQLPPLPTRRLPPRVARAGAGEPNATLVGREEISGAVLALRIRPDQPIPFAAGQYLSLGLVSYGRLVQRPYSPASPPGAPEVELLVRHVPHGELTPRLWRLPVGSRLRLGRAKGLFRLESGDRRHHLFMATGTGVAPMLSMIASLLASGVAPQMTLVHGVALRSELAYAARVAGWIADGVPLRYVPVLSRPQRPENAGWRGRSGHLTELLPALVWGIRAISAETVAYLCGNPAVVHHLARDLVGAGLPEDAIRREEYWPAVQATKELAPPAR